jgi:hypothetical protein
VVTVGLVTPTRPKDGLLAEGVELVSSQLEAGEEVVPLVISERWGDRRVEHSGKEGLETARAQFVELVRRMAGDERCALVRVGHVGLGEDAILVEVAGPGAPEAEVFVQRFRPKRGPLRGFKLVGEPSRAGTLGTAP